MKNWTNMLILLVMGSLFGLGCLCGSGPQCEAYLTTPEGKEYYGADKTKDTALRNACNNWCIVEDKEYDTLFKRWKETPAGKREGRFRGGKPKRGDATSDRDIMDFLYKKCAPRCVKATKSGKNKYRIKCKGNR